MNELKLEYGHHAIHYSSSLEPTMLRHQAILLLDVAKEHGFAFDSILFKPRILLLINDCAANPVSGVECQAVFQADRSSKTTFSAEIWQLCCKQSANFMFTA